MASRLLHGSLLMCMQIDDLILLLDCGWDDRYDVELLKPLRDVVGHVDGVLISHMDPQHLGALPYLVILMMGCHGACSHNRQILPICAAARSVKPEA